MIMWELKIIHSQNIDYLGLSHHLEIQALHFAKERAWLA